MITIENFKEMDNTKPLFIKTKTNRFILVDWEVDENSNIQSKHSLLDEGSYLKLMGGLNFDAIEEIRELDVERASFEIILERDNYQKVLDSGMFFEFHPELTGEYNEDFKLIWEALISVE